MAARNPPTFLQAGTHNAENTRNALGAPVLAGGIVNTADMLVAAPGGTQTVTVAAGQVQVLGSRAFQGVYHGINDAPVTLVIAASDPTNPRYDRVVAQIQDAAYSGVTNVLALVVITGTAAAAPLEPAIPADSVELARVLVPAASTAVLPASILDRRVRYVRRTAVYSSAVVADPALVVKAVTSQAGNLQEWQDPTGVVKSRITSSGTIGGSLGATARVRLTTSFNVNGGVSVDVAPVTIDEDTATAVSSAAGTFTVPGGAAGLYLVSVTWSTINATGANGACNAFLNVNGTDRSTALASASHMTTFTLNTSAARVVRLAAGDIVKFRAQGAGTTNTLNGVSGAAETGWQIARIGS